MPADVVIKNRSLSRRSLARNVLARSASAAALSLALALGAPAYADKPPKQVSIEAQPLGDAIFELSQQTGATIFVNDRLVGGKSAKTLNGVYTVEEALSRLLEGSGLSYRQTADGTYAVVQATAQITDRNGASLKPADEPSLEIEEIVVTGTNIRGIAPRSSPLQSFGQEDILRSGAANAQDFIRTLPADFGGGSQDFRAEVPNDRRGLNNVTGGASVNLRGLGSSATLVLLNGRRLAPSSSVGDFVDISLIPASAIERVDVLTDGASSIYGGDAVAGVVNFVLKDDFDGLETSLRFGLGTEQGSPEEVRVSVTSGRSWESGNVLGVYEYYGRDNLSAADRDFSAEAPLPNDLIPQHSRHSALVSFNQDVSSDFQLLGDVLFSRRESEGNITNFGGDFRRSQDLVKVFGLTAGGIWDFSETWSFDVTASYSAVDEESETVGFFPFALKIESELLSIDGRVSGVLFSGWAGDASLAVGGQFRNETFGKLAFPGGEEPDPDTERDVGREVFSAFGEFLLPLVSPENGVPGIHRMEISVSGRFEDYSDFGSSANPKVGIAVDPLDGLTFRSTFSTSFNPPELGFVGAADRQASLLPTSLLNAALGVEAADPSIADVPVFTVFGTDRNLDPETSRAFTAGLDVVQDIADGALTLSSTYFDISFEDRIDSVPIPDSRVQFDAVNIAFNNPAAFPPGIVVFFPTQAELSAEIDSLDLGFINPFEFALDDVAIINRAFVIQNISKTTVRGVDFDIGYDREIFDGLITVGLAGTYIADFIQQASRANEEIQTVNTLFNPIDLNLRGRVGYSTESFSAFAFVNYANSYETDNSATAQPVDSLTTLDVSLSMRLDTFGASSILRDTFLRFAVQDIFNAGPPETPSNLGSSVFGYDPTNASPIGRFVAVELTKRF